jgi:type IV pilus assembly protein PilO
MKIEEFSNLDPKNFGNWPIPVKGVIILVLCAITLFAGYWLDTQNQLVKLAKSQRQENELKKKFESKQWKAATLPKLKEQLAQIESTLSELLRKLPNEAQVDELIRDISQSVLANGLKQELFQPEYKRETEEKGLYVKLPIKLRAKGNYHSFGKFISGVATMNRIVTLHDVSIESSKDIKDETHPQTLEMIAQIYRYLEETEEENQEKGKKKKK